MIRKRLIPIALMISLLSISVSAAPNFSEVSGLATKTADERDNLKLVLAPVESASPELKQAAEEAMALWNAGQYDEALAILDQIDSTEAAEDLEVIHNWREPIPAAGPEFGTDVRVGPRDSVVSVDLDIHRASGTLWAVLRIEGDGYEHQMTVNRSTDGGATWLEVGYSYNPTQHMHAVAAAVCGDYLYIVYEWNHAVRVRRYDAVIAGMVQFSDMSWSYEIYSVSPISNSIRELALVSNQDMESSSHLMGLAAINGNGTLFFYVHSLTFNDLLWTYTYGDMVSAARGLSACWHVRPGSTPIYNAFVSYITSYNYVELQGINSSTLEPYTLMGSDVYDNTARVTSVSAYDNTVVCAYEMGGMSPRRLTYSYSTNGGIAWDLNWYLDANNFYGEMPAVCARDGGGVGVVQTYYTSPYITGPRFKWTDYPDIGGLQVRPSTVFANHFGGPVQPDIVYLGNGDYGIIYVSALDDGEAYFDHSGGHCCQGRVGDANGSGEDEPTIGDVSVLIDALFINSNWSIITCLEEADINQSGGTNPETSDITIGDVSYLIDYLFITGSGGMTLPDCL